MHKRSRKAALCVAFTAALTAPTYHPGHQRSTVRTHGATEPASPDPDLVLQRPVRARLTTRATSIQTPNPSHLVLRSTLLKHPAPCRCRSAHHQLSFRSG